MAIKRIPLYTCLLNGQPTDTVSARDLYTFLQLDRDFFHWVKTSSSKLYFVRGEDFIIVDNLIRPTPDTSAAVQKTKDYFIRLDMAYEMAMEEEGDLAQQASDYLRHCDTPQNRYIPPKEDRSHQTASLLVEPKVKQSDLDQYREANRAVKSMGLNEEPMVLPIYEVSKMIETIRFYQEKALGLDTPSMWLDQHIANVKAYANSQFMDG
ncbi:antA/AntB antirepressor family protein [Marinomonas transparens]|uniref:AntA/AntB antirepressor family protein n=1 Tax=Marinomonas transparens TaxID=2795388 RepID=A0A934JZC2_9GAMM|nr:antA/AntB antirepressor family protein [Marinomonas transparens]MBJ7539667.1 antA/AntB antirepressor family protein [Marinomonas transparens]